MDPSARSCAGFPDVENPSQPAIDLGNTVIEYSILFFLQFLSSSQAFV